MRNSWLFYLPLFVVCFVSTTFTALVLNAIITEGWFVFHTFVQDFTTDKVWPWQISIFFSPGFLNQGWPLRLYVLYMCFEGNKPICLSFIENLIILCIDMLTLQKNINFLNKSCFLCKYPLAVPLSIRKCVS